MARDILVDTSSFSALLVAKDDRHNAASDILSKAAKSKRRFIATDYIARYTWQRCRTAKQPARDPNLIPAYAAILLSSVRCE